MPRFATEEERIQNALTPTNRDLLNFIRNAEMAAGKRLDWDGREDIIQRWTEEVALAVGEWAEQSGDGFHPTVKEFVYILQAVAQRYQEGILQEEKG